MTTIASVPEQLQGDSASFRQAVADAVRRAFAPETRHDRLALKKWDKAWDEAATAPSEDEVIAFLTQRELLQPVVAFHIAAIHETAMASAHEEAKKRKKFAGAAVRFQVEECVEVADPGGNWSIDPFRLVVVRELDEAEAYKAGVATCTWLAREATVGQLRAVQRGKFDQHETVQTAAEMVGRQFIVDVAAFLIKAGDDGRKLVERIIGDAREAETIAADDDAAKPLRYLAMMVIKLEQ